MKLLPDWLRRALGLAPRFRNGHSRHMPIEVESAVNEVLERLVVGTSRDLQTCSNVKTKQIVKAATTLLEMWKDTCKKVQADSAEDLAWRIRTKPPTMKWANGFLKRWQWGWLASNTKGQYLSDDCAQMQEARHQHRTQRSVNGVPWSMVLNYDQLWKCGHEPPSKVLHKCTKKEKKVCNKDVELRGGDLAGKHLDAIMEIVGEDMTKRMGLSQHRSKARKTTPRSEFVIGARLGVTAVTSTWGNGEMGPLAVCIPTGVLSQTFMRDLNLAFKAQVFVFESGTDTHFMNSDTTLTYMNSLLGPATCFLHA